MTRIVASTESKYAEYHIAARVYSCPNGTSVHNIVAKVMVDGRTRAIYRQRVVGLYWARKTMFDMLADAHGAY